MSSALVTRALNLGIKSVSYVVIIRKKRLIFPYLPSLYLKKKLALRCYYYLSKVYARVYEIVDLLVLAIP